MKRPIKENILAHGAASGFFRSHAGFAVNVYTDYADNKARYSAPNVIFTDDMRRGTNTPSFRNGFTPSYIVRVWPKHQDTSMRVPEPLIDRKAKALRAVAAFAPLDRDHVRAYLAKHGRTPAVNTHGDYFTADGTLMNEDGTRSIFDDVDE